MSVNHPAGTWLQVFRPRVLKSIINVQIKIKSRPWNLRQLIRQEVLNLNKLAESAATV